MFYNIKLFLNHFNSPPFLTEHHTKQTSKLCLIYSNGTVHTNFTRGHVATPHKQMRTTLFWVIKQ